MPDATASPLSLRAATQREFTHALHAASRNAGRLVLIEAVLEQADVPPLLQDLAQILSGSDHYGRPCRSGPPGAAPAGRARHRVRTWTKERNSHARRGSHRRS